MASGTADKITGTVKEAVGKVTGDKRTEAEGKTDQVKGSVKNATDNISESAKGVRDSLRKEWCSTPAADGSRGRVHLYIVPVGPCACILDVRRRRSKYCAQTSTLKVVQIL